MTFIWNWGDGTMTTEGAVATHVYADLGRYEITATEIATDLTGSTWIGAVPMWDVAHWDVDEWRD